MVTDMCFSSATPLRREHIRRGPYHGLEMVVSGGQSGVDRAALDAAMAAGLEVGGWCPRGRWAEDGPIAPHYPLREADLRRVCRRTLWNIRDSDATLVIVCGRPRGGTALTIHGQAGQRPRLVVDPRDRRAVARIRRWLHRHRVRVLNIGGPRASEDPEIYRLASELLAVLFHSGAVSRY
jgi:hypothetical protein